MRFNTILVLAGVFFIATSTACSGGNWKTEVRRDSAESSAGTFSDRGSDDADLIIQVDGSECQCECPNHRPFTAISPVIGGICIECAPGTPECARDSAESSAGAGGASSSDELEDSGNSGSGNTSDPPNDDDSAGSGNTSDPPNDDDSAGSGNTSDPPTARAGNGGSGNTSDPPTDDGSAGEGETFDPPTDNGSAGSGGVGETFDPPGDSGGTGGTGDTLDPPMTAGSGGTGDTLDPPSDGGSGGTGDTLDPPLPLGTPCPQEYKLWVQQADSGFASESDAVVFCENIATGDRVEEECNGTYCYFTLLDTRYSWDCYVETHGSDEPHIPAYDGVACDAIMETVPVITTADHHVLEEASWEFSIADGECFFRLLPRAGLEAEAEEICL